ncbi:MAG: twin transmembrane helix small protein [Geminicoccaceae bacterium]
MTLLHYLLIAAMLATLGVLIVGVTGFLRGGAFNEKYGNKLMRARVGLQFVALAILAILFLAH